MSDGGHQLTKEEEDYFRRRFEPLKIFSERTPAPDPSHGAIFNAHVTARQGSVSLNSSYGGAPRPPALGGYSTSVYGSTPPPAKNASSNEPWLSQYAQPVELREIGASMSSDGSRGPPHNNPRHNTLAQPATRIVCKSLLRHSEAKAPHHISPCRVTRLQVLGNCVCKPHVTGAVASKGVVIDKDLAKDALKFRMLCVCTP
ncbi:hypothetical protein DB88DRAFT_473523 [Papiliotrema laurentii]|uniref:Uncharacterized protein n=1 Tax=Papiliotrema laurentii TaxID=5418 RepID=A0AAD9CYM2_PAPLA|nr:hypothetical protein DB88DRAFT_473523 [Papiliotrema laurentii]